MCFSGPQTHGHAGTIASGGNRTAAAKLAMLAGATTVKSAVDLGKTLAGSLKK
jgi:succinyl-CoA synthetase alpha subunit